MAPWVRDPGRLAFGLTGCGMGGLLCAGFRSSPGSRLKLVGCHVLRVDKVSPGTGATGGAGRSSAPGLSCGNRRKSRQARGSSPNEPETSPACNRAYSIRYVPIRLSAHLSEAGYPGFAPIILPIVAANADCAVLAALKHRPEGSPFRPSTRAMIAPLQDARQSHSSRPAFPGPAAMRAAPFGLSRQRQARWLRRLQTGGPALASSAKRSSGDRWDST